MTAVKKVAKKKVVKPEVVIEEKVLETKPVDNTVECHHCDGKGTVNGGYKICEGCNGACKFEL